MTSNVTRRIKAGLIALAMVLSQAVLPVQSAYATPGSGNDNENTGGNANNAGDIKVRDTNDINDLPENNPMLSSCSVVVEFYNFNNATANTATIEFETQAPTAEAVVSPVGAQIVTIEADGHADGQGNNDLDGSYTYDLSFVGAPKTEGNTTGYKVTVDVKVNGTVGGPKQKTFWVPASCQTVTATPVTPLAPSKSDICETENDKYTIPTTVGVDYLVDGQVVDAGTYTTGGAASVTVTAQAQVNYVLTGQTEFTLTFTDTECEVPPTFVTPTAPSKTDICETDDDMYTIPATTGVNYTVDGAVLAAGDYSANGSTSITVTAVAQENYVIEGQSVFVLTFTNTECENTNVCTVSNNLFDREWTYDGTAFPEAGGNGSYNFEPTGLYLSTPVVDSYVYGLMDAGNTPIGDVDAMGYKALRLPQSAGFAATLPAYILVVDTNGLSVADGEKYFFYEPYNTDQTRAAVEGTFQTWDAFDNGNAIWWMSGTGQALRSWDSFVSQFPDGVVLAYGFNQGTYNAETYTAVQDITFDCATTSFKNKSTGGSGGGGETPTTPTVPTTPVVPTPVVPAGGSGALLPEELPMTGENGSIVFTWIALLAAILTYGAVYYMQPKKRFEQ